MIDPSWRIQFKDESQKTEVWYNTEQPEGSLLFWSVKRGDIPFEKYIAWAQPHFLMPYLADEFFTNKPGDLTKTPVSFPWSPECAPLGFWEGVTYIACLAPPSQLRKSAHRICFVLCKPQQIEEWWKQVAIQFKRIGEQDPFESLATSAPVDISVIKSEFAQINEGQYKDLKAEISESLKSKKKKTGEASLISQAMQLNPDEMELSFQKCFTRLTKYYKRSMIFTLDRGELNPFFWEPSFQPSKEARETPIELEDASIFRIVSRSLKAYHGYIVSNPINRVFIQNWCESVLPEHITIAPVLINSHLSAMIVSIADSNIPQKPSLALATAAAKQLSHETCEILGIESKKESA